MKAAAIGGGGGGSLPCALRILGLWWPVGTSAEEGKRLVREQRNAKAEAAEAKRPKTG